MSATVPTIVATSMGFNRARDPWRPGPVFRYMLELSGRPAHPRLCFVATATRDAQASIAGFYRAFEGSAVRAAHLALFPEPNVSDIRGHLLNQDVIWVDRGNTADLLASWHKHGLPETLRECWQAGVVLGGESAGSLCWHAQMITDSYGALRSDDGLGFLPYANAVHFDTSGQREALRRLVADADVIGLGTDDGVGLHYSNHQLVNVISDRPRAGAYRLTRDVTGRIREQFLAAQRLKRDKGS